MKYFDHPYINNSKLTALSKELRGDYSPEPFEAYRFGSLVDAVVTEAEKVDRNGMQIVDTGYKFSDSELKSADRMHTALKLNKFTSHILAVGKTQVEKYVAGVQLEHNGVSFSLNMKCKYDFTLPGEMFCDLKSTVATSQKQFEAACEQFCYWRQMALYGMLGGYGKAIIVGVSKRNYKIFILTMAEGDSRWESGKKQYEELAYKYWLYKT